MIANGRAHHRNGESSANGHITLPPHNRDAERSLLASMLRDNSIISEVAPLVSAADFYVYGHQKIYEAITKLNDDDSKPADIVTVAEWLMQKNLIDDVGGPTYLAELWEAAPSAAHYRQYAEIIRQKAIVRNLIHACTEVQRDAYDPSVPAEELVRLAERRILEIAEPGAKAGYRFAPMESQEFAATDFRPRWLVQRLLVRDQPCILGGPKKALKTSLLIDLALSLGSGTPLLGVFEVYNSVRTVLISGESGPHTIQETAQRVAVAKGISLATANVLWDFRLPQLAHAAELAALGRGLRDRGAEVCIIDPLYLTLLAGQGDQGMSAANLYDMGPLLMRVAKTCLRAGATPILAHHARKGRINAYDPLELDDLAFAGVAEFARQWLLLSRREPFEPGSGVHRLWLGAGGSIGHGGLWAVDIDEGSLDDNFGGRKWGVQITTATESIAAKDQAKDDAKQQAMLERNKDDEAKVLGALDRADSDRKGYGVEQLCGLVDISKGRVKQAIARLVTDGFAEHFPVEASIGSNAKRTVAGVRRRPLK